MNFGIIFLCLLIGAVVGYEFGKAATVRRIRGVIDRIGTELRKTAEDIQKKKDEQDALKKERQRNNLRMMDELMPKMGEENFRRFLGISPEEMEQLKKLKEGAE